MRRAEPNINFPRSTKELARVLFSILSPPQLEPSRRLILLGKRDLTGSTVALVTESTVSREVWVVRALLDARYIVHSEATGIYLHNLPDRFRPNSETVVIKDMTRVLRSLLCVYLQEISRRSPGRRLRQLPGKC